MRTIGDFKRALDRFEAEDAVYEALEETKDAIADLNVEQLNKGLRADGSTMPDYSQVSVEFWGKPDGPIKLLDTSAFYRGFFAEIKKGGVYSFSTDPKADMLGKRYGKYIYGLSGPFKRVYRDDALLPAFIRLRKKALGI